MHIKYEHNSPILDASAKLSQQKFCSCWGLSRKFSHHPKTYTVGLGPQSPQGLKSSWDLGPKGQFIPILSTMRAYFTMSQNSKVGRF